MERPSLEVTSVAQWRDWLSAHHATSDGIWLVSFKKGFEGHVPYPALVEQSLCFGWIDSRTRAVDAERTSITMTPRRKGSRWMQPNRDRVELMEAQGLMTDAGRAAIAAAKASGAWDDLRPVETLEVPTDLAAALAQHAVRRNWDALTRSAKFQHLLRLHDAKRPATRERHLARIVDALR